jgi:hypothetical protein
LGLDKDAPLKSRYEGDATDGPTIAFVYSCATGEESGRDVQGDDCSAFTRAFAEAIELERGPAELEAIAAEAKRRLAGFSGGGQTLVVSGRAGRGDSWEHLVIKEDEAARFRERLKRSNWSRRLAEIRLFAELQATLPTFATQVQALAMRAEEQVAKARRVLPAQRWRDEGAWVRQAARIQHLFLSGTESENIPLTEVAVLLAVPFVYEAALAAIEARLAAANAVLDPEAASGSGYIVNAWRSAWQDGDAAQFRRGLIARGKQEAADDYSCWSLVDFCHTSGEVWDAQGGAQERTGWALDAVSAVVAPAPFPEITQDRRVQEILSTPRVLRLARLMFASFDDVTLDSSNSDQSLDPQFSCGEFNNQLIINEVRLAHLLNLGSQVALDPRRMPSLLAEHIGTDNDLSADWLRMQLAGAEWHARATDGGSLSQNSRLFDLRLDCANDAVDAALLAAVDALESYRTRLTQRQDLHAEAMLELLPAGFTVNRLNTAPSGWHPTRPPLRFELDRRRIISLLMGQQLYGERWPALRELYQNALDACRYRRASEQLAKHEGRTRARNAYRGRIIIRFGLDGGRRYVECVDDGIGMADRHIRRLFAYAGQRFADSHEFHIDRARWEEADIKFFPNSRFGIGVLSYFMLAEELDIASRRWVPSVGLAPPAVRARVIGSGSLFRLGSDIDPTRLADDYGTSVRLYLREDAPDDNALQNSILDWLALPEVGVSIWRESQVYIDLAAGEPTDLLRNVGKGVLLPLHGSEDTKGAPRIYLAPCAARNLFGSPGSRVALADGIITNLADNPWPLSIIVNLSEDLRSSLTVDRRRVDPAEAQIETVLRLVREHGGAALATWSNPDFMALHQTLRELHPDVAVAADAALRVKTAPRLFSALPLSDLQWPISVAGLSDLDADVCAELLLAFRSEARQNEPEDTRSIRRELEALCIRGDPKRSVHPDVTKAISVRAAELVDAGLRLPNWLRQAASFESAESVQAFPARSGPALRAINECGHIPLREWVRWTEDDLMANFDAARAIAASWPEVLMFDLDRLKELEPSHRSLCRLSFGDRLTWIELVYFSQSQGLPIETVVTLAEGLSSFGVEVPDSEELSQVLPLTEIELGALKDYVERTKDLPYNTYPGYIYIWMKIFITQEQE